MPDWDTFTAEEWDAFTAAQWDAFAAIDDDPEPPSHVAGIIRRYYQAAQQGAY